MVSWALMLVTNQSISLWWVVELCKRITATYNTLISGDIQHMIIPFSGGGAADIIQDRARPLLLLLQTGKTFSERPARGFELKWILFFSWWRRQVSLRAFVSSNLTTKLNQSTQSTSYTGGILSNQVDASFTFVQLSHFHQNCLDFWHHHTSSNLCTCRFNVHQEVVLAGLYNLYSFRLTPIFFYTYAVFALQVFNIRFVNVRTVYSHFSNTNIVQRHKIWFDIIFLQGVFLSALYLIRYQKRAWNQKSDDYDDLHNDVDDGDLNDADNILVQLVPLWQLADRRAHCPLCGC